LKGPRGERDSGSEKGVAGDKSTAVKLHSGRGRLHLLADLLADTGDVNRGAVGNLSCYAGMVDFGVGVGFYRSLYFQVSESISFKLSSSSVNFGSHHRYPFLELIMNLKQVS
jgi:hypothetical protein